MGPASLDIFPEISFWDTLKSNVDKIKDKATDWFKDTFSSSALLAPV